MALSFAPTGSARAAPTRWTAEAGKSQLVVRVYKKGLLSGFAHDHEFAAGKFQVTATLDESGSAPRFEVVVAADSLRDRNPELSPEDRAKVDAQASGDAGLDASRFPEIRFTSREPTGAGVGAQADGSFEGKFPGTLSLHGRQNALSVPVRASREGEGWRARGTLRFLQSDFGIEPYSGFLGTIAVHDEVQVEFDLFLAPVH
jgi:polyisoprenoid-binding protein YceI